MSSAPDRAADRQKALDFGAKEFVDLDNDSLEDVGGVDLVFDVIGGDIGKRIHRLIQAGGTHVSIVGSVEVGPVNGLAIDFVVEADRAQLTEIIRRVRDGRLRSNIGDVSTLNEAVEVFNSTQAGPRGRRSSEFVNEDSGKSNTVYEHDLADCVFPLIGSSSPPPPPHFYT